MKIGVLTVPLSDYSLDETLGLLKSRGIDMVEIGCGGNPGTAHCDPDILLNDDQKFAEFQDTFKKHSMQISALSCHANPIHPRKEIAEQHDQVITKCILMAERLGVTRINTFSGCPGDGEGAKCPNWVVCPWPEDFVKVLDYQWNEVLIPYWKQKGAFAEAHGTKIAIEMHPGFCVYNPETLLRLREAVGDVIGANFDPSHLIWQGIDPVAAIRQLQGAIYHFHAKDTIIDRYITARNGVLDTKSYADGMNRSWIFRTVGYGNDTKYWKDIISTLRMTGYDYVVSIEHEDGLMSVREGLFKAIDFLKEVMIFEEQGKIFWA